MIPQQPRPDFRGFGEALLESDMVFSFLDRCFALLKLWFSLQRIPGKVGWAGKHRELGL